MYQKKKLVDIPKNTKLIKISCINLDYNDFSNKLSDFKLLINYLFSDCDGIELDVICLQNINNKKLLQVLIRDIYKASKKFRSPINIAPDINYNFYDSYDSSVLSNLIIDENKYQYSNNIIISKYPIIFYDILSLDKGESNKLIVANIDINDHIITIYNTCFTEDSLGFNNYLARQKEFEILKKSVSDNKKKLSIINDNKNKYQNKYIIKDINIICCSFNIDEYKNDSINSELLKYFKNINGIDIFRLNNKDEKYYTTNKNKRNNYILFIKDFIGLSNDKDILNKIYCDNNIGIVLNYVIDDMEFNNNYPIESLFILNMDSKIKCIE